MNIGKDPAVLLVYPPQGDPTQPYLSIPALAGYLKKEGFTGVAQRDLNIEAFESFTHPGHIKKTVAALKERLASEKDPSARVELARCLATAPVVEERIAWARQVVRSPGEFYDYKKYSAAGNIIQRALEIVSAEFYPTAFSTYRFTTKYSTEKVEELLAATKDPGANPFIRFFRKGIIKDIKKNRPEVLGISVTYDSQLIGALTLARMAREELPSLRVVIGGGYVSNLHSIIAAEPRLFQWVDAYVVHEGEGAFRELLRFYQGLPNRCDDLSNIIRYDREKGTVTRGTHRRVEQVDDLPPADFEGLPLDKYFTAEFVPLLDIERGCYWGRCSFCSYGVGIGPCSDYRPRKAETVVGIIRDYVEKYGVKHVVFSTDAAAPSHLTRIARGLLSEGLDVRWHCTSRVEESFTPERLEELWRGGLRHMIFGVESGNQRVLDSMGKGVIVETLIEVFGNLRRQGITHKSMFIIGFPGETRDEALDTYRFILENRRIITFLSLEPFALVDGSIVHSDSEKFGITRIEPDREKDLGFVYGFETCRGMGAEEVFRMYGEIWPMMQMLFGGRCYPFVESGASVHTLLYSSRYGWEFPPPSGVYCEEYRDMPRAEFEELAPTFPKSRFAVEWNPELAAADIPGVNSLAGFALGARSMRAVYSDADNRIMVMDPFLFSLLESFDGGKTVREAVEAYPPSVTGRLYAVLRYLLYTGIISASPGEEGGRAAASLAERDGVLS